MVSSEPFLDSLPVTPSPKPIALEFFAGGGLARLGLEPWFDVAWANDIDPMKCAAWRANFGAEGLIEGDVATLDGGTIPPSPCLAWASFPCQDLSLAGDRAGLSGRRSSTFFGFMDRLNDLARRGDPAPVVVVENVKGLLNSRQGADFTHLMAALATAGYRAGCLEIDAASFLPQSRPRVFIVAVRRDWPIHPALVSKPGAPNPFLTPAVMHAMDRLPAELQSHWVDWHLPAPDRKPPSLADLVDHADQTWWTQAKVAQFFTQLSPAHAARLAALQADEGAHIGTMYRRIRTDQGSKHQRAEIRFDGKAGCLRTPAGGSSRQFWIMVEGDNVRIRPINPREAMRLMGVADTYHLPHSTLAGLKIAGDGVAVPVVAWLSQHLLAPLAQAQPRSLHHDARLGPMAERI